MLWSKTFSIQINMISALKILADAALWYIKSSSLPKFCKLKTI